MSRRNVRIRHSQLYYRAPLPLGVMDSDTRSAMAMPRCGNSDTPINGSAAGQRRGQGSAPYVYLGSKWMHVDLSYKITKYTRQITRAGVDRAVARALKVRERELRIPPHASYHYQTYIYIYIEYIIEIAPFDVSSNSI